MTYRDLFRVMLAHGVTRRQAIRILSELRGSDPVAKVASHPSGAAFEAAVAHYLRTLGTEHGDPAESVKVRWDVQRLAWIVGR